MNLKKILTGACAGALALTLALPAFADLKTEYTATTTIPDTVGDISVTVPATTGSLYINVDGAPYELKDATVGAYKVAGSTVTDTFFTDPGLLVNTGDSALTVKVSLTSHVTGTTEFAATTAAGTSTNNILAGSLYVATATMDASKKATAAWDTAQDIAIPDATASNDGTAADQAVTAQLPAAQEVQDPATFTNVTVPGCLAYRLAGDTKLLAAGWGTSEATVTVVFTLTPAGD